MSEKPNRGPSVRVSQPEAEAMLGLDRATMRALIWDSTFESYLMNRHGVTFLRSEIERLAREGIREPTA